MFMELQIREHQAVLEKEAEHIRMIRSGRKEHGKIKKQYIEKFANLLISFGERLKMKYCPDTAEKKDLSVYSSSDVCRS